MASGMAMVRVKLGDSCTGVGKAKGRIFSEDKQSQVKQRAD